MSDQQEQQHQQQQQQQPPCPPGQGTPLDLDGQLKELEAKIKDYQKDLKTAEIEIKKNEDQIKALSALITQVNGVVDGYQERYEELKRKEEDFRGFCDDEKTCLTKVLGSNGTELACSTAESVMKEIIDIGVEIEKKEVGCAQAIGELEKAKRERADCAKTLNRAKEAFEAWKDPVKAIEARFKDLEKLKKQVCTEHEAKNYALAYYLLMFGDACCAQIREDESCTYVEQEFFESYEKYCVRLTNPEDYPPKIVEPDDLKGKIVEAWNSYKNADTKYNEQDAVVKTLEKNLEVMKAQLTAKKKDFETTIRRKLIELNDQQS
jgi:DNA repair exonuclease SbcCD ATPase subunit